MRELDRYLELGWQLMPCRAQSKRGWLRWDEASNDPRQVRLWARRCGPHANWAVVCGRASGLIVVDVEGDAGDAEIRRLRRDRRLAWTPQCNSGGFKRGYHLYFLRPTGRELRGKVWIHPEIEVRADRHLVLLPPSRHDVTGWRYQWEPERAPWQIAPPEAPAWLLEALAPAAPVERQPVDLGEVGEAYIRTAIAGEAEAVAAAPAGQRNHTLNLAAFSLARLVGPGLTEGQVIDALVQAALQAGLDAHEARATIRSGLNGRRRKAA